MNIQVKWAAFAVAGTLLAACSQFYVANPSIRTASAAKKETVVVVFGKAENGKVCPIRVVPLGADCPPGLGGDETVCREVGDGPSDRLKLVKWEKDSEAPPGASFAIRFQNLDPCTNGGNGNVCPIKKTNDLQWGASPYLVAKYDVVSDDCRPLDPYIIVMR